MGGQPNTHAALSGGKVCKPPVHGPDEGSPSLGNHQGGTSSISLDTFLLELSLPTPFGR